MSCPSCGARGLPIIYGRPGGDLIKKAEAGEVILGGCCPDENTHQCSACSKKFAEKKEEGPGSGGVSSDPESWASLVGTDAGAAKAAIQAARPDSTVDLVEEGMMVTMDFREDRVRIWMDANKKVARAPRPG
eukprot:TRINITY_DN101294_c0_g1_i1.p2 TRINITY_DN101294_c0_g1~~TRINITY_DN101294_c0_g1_i1.p2  ORF type:complete len:132 (+),score=27.07 TRINITY_DN101294_c0_g1_i1:60-455(+)